MVYSYYDFRNDYLAKLVEKTHVSRDDLATKIGISPASLQLYCQNKTKPSPAAIIKMATYFCVPVDVLLGRCTEEEFNDIYKNYNIYFMQLRSHAYDEYLLKKKKNTDQGLPAIKGDDSIAGWPYNLIDTIWCEKKDIYVTNDMYAGIEKAIGTLSPREQKCIYMYFKDEMTLEDIGKTYNVTRERARQVVSKAIRKLRHPVRVKLIRYGLKGSKLSNEVAELEKKKESLMFQISVLADKIALVESNDENAKKRVDSFNTLLDMDLSVRTYRCLQRANCETLQDVVDIVASGEVHKLRNFGRKSLTELLTVLKDKYGYDFFGLYGWLKVAPKVEVSA